MTSTHRRVLAAGLLLVTTTALVAVEQAAAQERTLRFEAGRAAASTAVENPTACAGGVVPDDGTIETGYGWISSVVAGQYVQALSAPDADRRAGLVSEVCVCWLRTRDDDTIDFDLVFYGQAAGGGPAPTPYASVAVSAAGVPRALPRDVPPVLTGRYYSYELRDVRLRPGVNYMGVRWDASRDAFFFVCADTSPSTPAVEAFFIDELAPVWTSFFESRDPIFIPHRALLVRARIAPFEIPALDLTGLISLTLALGIAGCWRARRQRSASTRRAKSKSESLMPSTSWVTRWIETRL